MRKTFAVLLVTIGVLLPLASSVLAAPASHASPQVIQQHNHGQEPMAGTVSYNQKTGKFHNANCRYYGCANCITISREDAIRRGGVACKVCGG